MATKRVAPGEWKTVFDRFTREYLRDELPETVTIEVVSPEVGDQLAVRDARLLGVSYDPKSRFLEVDIEGIEHLVFRPADIWVVEDDVDGFLETIDLVRADGTKEIMHLYRSGVPA